MPAMLFKWRCEKLNINCVKHPCKQAKSMGTFACIDCGGPIEIKQEAVDMSSKCKHEGCKRTSQAGKKGLCFTHYNELMGLVTKRPSVVKAEPVSGLVADPVSDLPADFGKVTNADGDKVSFGTDRVVVLALREAWAAKEAEWLEALSGLKPGATLVRAADMVQAVEGLVF